MDPVIIHTGLTHFTALRTLSAMDRTTICGSCEFHNAPAFMALEACAQLGAFHVRRLKNFNCHAFLLKINRFDMPASDRINGPCRLSARLTGQSNLAFSYDIKLTDQTGTTMQGNFLFAVKPYDDRLDQNILKSHYKKVFSCLRTASEND